MRLSASKSKLKTCSISSFRRHLVDKEGIQFGRWFFPDWSQCLEFPTVVCWKEYSFKSIQVCSNLSKRILLKWITRLNGYHLSGPIQTQCNVWNMDKWIFCLCGHSRWGPSAIHFSRFDCILGSSFCGSNPAWINSRKVCMLLSHLTYFSCRLTQRHRQDNSRSLVTSANSDVGKWVGFLTVSINQRWCNGTWENLGWKMVKSLCEWSMAWSDACAACVIVLPWFKHVFHCI